MATEEQVRAVKNAHSARLLSLPGVSGVSVAQGKNGEPVLAILIDAPDSWQEALLPREIDGVPVEIIPSGAFRKL